MSTEATAYPAEIVTPRAIVVDPDATQPAPRQGRETGWWGMVVLIATEAMIFAGLISTYFFLRGGSHTWPQGGIEPPELKLIVAFTVVLLARSLPVFWAEAAIRKGRQGPLRIGLLLSFLMGAAFLGNQVYEYRQLTFGLRDNAYASIFYLTTGLHGLHVLIGLLMSLVIQLKAWMGKFTAERHLSVQVFSLYWHFV